MKWVFKGLVVIALFAIFLELHRMNEKLTPAPDPRFVELADSYARLQQGTENKVKEITKKINYCLQDDKKVFTECVRNYGIRIDECKESSRSR